MASIDTYLHIIGIELLAMLAIVLPLLDDKVHKRALSTVFLAVQGFMLAHFATHLLPSKIAAFIYSSHHEYRSIKTLGPNRT
ncbi:hypothetical protein IVG45_11240 [Methylomonas sp. LL1]|uniref:hypothetical protein n=1 Tax=Methylomonas sp. LL1 TaxID=2785785 RepID=UPI0018C39D38|nr:hypothetical protein [Methylomonas sp. LL1]QPK61480.1 hypothetical protein IVG45_11240 [Methylomonas sp. LL1]